VSAAFRFLIQAREKLYNCGILPTLRLNHPVISVGNLTVGGTGKTPLVIALAEAFRERGFRPVILSRGYGRTSRGVIVAGSNWKEVGDEPFLMKQRLVNVPVVVGADRYQAGLAAEKNKLGDLFILDDGFQHRRLHRDVDIVTIDPVEWAAGEALLPRGPWREPKSAAARAHAACVQSINGAAMPSLPIPEFAVHYEVEGIYSGDARVEAESLRQSAVVAFAGIAKPERFFSTLESIGIRPVRCVPFRDHHDYSKREIEGLGGDILITTEKDAVRLGTTTGRTCCYVRISAKIGGLERLISLVMRRLPNV
jgi:tetraacyldisaccharide 4'-kinase